MTIEVQQCFSSTVGCFILTSELRFRRAGVNGASELSMTDEDAGRYDSLPLRSSLAHEERVKGASSEVRTGEGKAKEAKKDRDRTMCQL